MQSFRAVEDFHSDETHSDYVAGLTYTMRPPSMYPDGSVAQQRAEALQTLVPQWAAEGKVEFTAVVDGQVAGQGGVS